MLSRVEIDKEALRSNVKWLRSLLAKNTQFMAVIKSNAYGHDMVKTAETIKDLSDWFGVVTAEEALVLRKSGIEKPILLLGAPDSKLLNELAEKNISVPVYSFDQLSEYCNEVAEFDHRLNVHLKVETGLNRLGFSYDECRKALEIISVGDNFRLEGIYSHLAAVEEQDTQLTKNQVGEFRRFLEFAPAGLVRHISASGAAILYPDYHFDMVRCGIATYGMWPSDLIKERYYAKNDTVNPLRPVLNWKTELVQIKRIKQGSVGYGASYKVQQPRTVGVLPIGYADGFDRGLSNIGEVLIDGTRCRVLGRVAMNMTVVDVTDVKAARVGDEVVLIGRQKDENISAEEIANKLGTINYEITTRIAQNIPRLYL